MDMINIFMHRNEKKMIINNMNINNSYFIGWIVSLTALATS